MVRMRRDPTPMAFTSTATCNPRRPPMIESTTKRFRRLNIFVGLRRRRTDAAEDATEDAIEGATSQPRRDTTSSRRSHSRSDSSTETLYQAPPDTIPKRNQSPCNRSSLNRARQSIHGSRTTTPVGIRPSKAFKGFNMSFRISHQPGGPKSDASSTHNRRCISRTFRNLLKKRKNSTNNRCGSQTPDLGVESLPARSPTPVLLPVEDLTLEQALTLRHIENMRPLIRKLYTLSGDHMWC